MKRRCLTVLMCLIPLPATASDATQAVRAHMQCGVINADRIDDGRMDIKRLAEKIQPLCRAKHEASMVASSAQAWKVTPKAKARELELQHTMAAVALYRDRFARR